MNKLFCTFVLRIDIDSFIYDLNQKYNILYNKIFVLEIKDSEEFILTYNTEQGNTGTIPKNTIMVHRKKESNTLYTINALNSLIKSKNNGYLDKSYQIDWNEHRNSVLLYSNEEPYYNKLNTILHKIVKI